MSSIVQLGRTHDVVCAEAGSDQVKRHAAERIRPRRKWGAISTSEDEKKRRIAKILSFGLGDARSLVAWVMFCEI